MRRFFACWNTCQLVIQFQFIVNVIMWTHCYHVQAVLSCVTECYYVGVECYHVVSNVIMWGRMLACGFNVIMWGYVNMWDQCYHVVV
jgi:hypothetical protein